jgi:hypothetical protein
MSLTLRGGATLVSLLLLFCMSVETAAAQTDAAALGAQNLRPYWHVFVGYALAWLLVFGWVVSIARRLTRIERSLGT